VRIYLIFALFLISGVFFSGGANPFSILFFMEITITIFVVSAVAYTLRAAVITKTEMIILIFPIAYSIHSSVLAVITFGQPFVFGLIEERRLFLIYSYFLIMVIYKNCYLSINKFVMSAFWVAVAISMLGILYSMEVIAGFQELDFRESSLRGNRANFSSVYIGVVLLLSYGVIHKILLRRQLVVFAAGVMVILAFVFYVNQTRQLILAVGVATLFCYAANLNLRKFIYLVPYLVIFLIVGGILFFSVFASTELISKYAELFGQLISEDYINDSARALALNVVYDELALYGNGALSLMYNDGFERVYGPFFFLSDIGIFGTVYRFGIFSIIYIGLTVYIFRILTHYSSHNVLKVYFSSIVLFFIIQWPVSGILEYRGAELGLLIAISTLLLRKRGLNYQERRAKPLSILA
jgi:hypothetical protein